MYFQVETSSTARIKIGKLSFIHRHCRLPRLAPVEEQATALLQQKHYEDGTRFLFLPLSLFYSRNYVIYIFDRIYLSSGNESNECLRSFKGYSWTEALNHISHKSDVERTLRNCYMEKCAKGSNQMRSERELFTRNSLRLKATGGRRLMERLKWLLHRLILYWKNWMGIQKELIIGWLLKGKTFVIFYHSSFRFISQPELNGFLIFW